jgi:hypothetical protein
MKDLDETTLEPRGWERGSRGELIYSRKDQLKLLGCYERSAFARYASFDETETRYDCASESRADQEKDSEDGEPGIPLPNPGGQALAGWPRGNQMLALLSIARLGIMSTQHLKRKDTVSVKLKAQSSKQQCKT